MATMNSIEGIINRRIETGEIALTWTRREFETLNDHLRRSFLVYRPGTGEKTHWGEGPNENSSSLHQTAFKAYIGLEGQWFPEDMNLEERVYCVRNEIRPSEIEAFQSTPRAVWDWARGIEESRAKGSPYHLPALAAVDLWRRNEKALTKVDAPQLHVWERMKGLVPDRDVPFTGYICAQLGVDVHYLKEAVERAGWINVRANARKLMEWEVGYYSDVLLTLRPIACQKHAIETQGDVYQRLRTLDVLMEDMVPALEEVTFTWPYHKGGERIWIQPGIVWAVQKALEGSWREAVQASQRLASEKRGSVIRGCKWDLLYGEEDLPHGVRNSTPRAVVEWLRRHADSRAMQKERPIHLPGGETASYRYIDMIDEIREEDLVNGVKTAPDRVMAAAKERRELVLQSEYVGVDFPKNGPYRSDRNLRWIDNSDALKEEGRVMNHCVGGYVRACIEEKTWIYHFGAEAPKGITVEINRDATGQPFVRQALGYGDSRQPDMVAKLKQHLAKKEVQHA